LNTHTPTRHPFKTYLRGVQLGLGFGGMKFITFFLKPFWLVGEMQRSKPYTLHYDFFNGEFSSFFFGMEKMCFSSVKRVIRKKTSGTSFEKKKKKLLKTQFMQYSPNMTSTNYSNCPVFKVRFYLFVSTLLEDLNTDCSCACFRPSFHSILQMG
jgi:hypothetical protein